MKARLTELSRALIRQRLRSTPPDCGEQQRSESVPECQNGMYRFARPAECAIPRITAHQCDEMIRLARAFLDASMRKTLRKTGFPVLLQASFGSRRSHVQIVSPRN